MGTACVGPALEESAAIRQGHCIAVATRSFGDAHCGGCCHQSALPLLLLLRLRLRGLALQAGDHVRVLNGPHAGERGMVVSVDGPQCVLLPDTRQAELRVFVRDLTEAKESGTGGLDWGRGVRCSADPFG